MRIAALYDIHGNLPALRAVLDVVADRRPDMIVVGGDVMPGPLASECLEVLDSLDTRVEYLRGNGDREVLQRLDGQESSGLPERVREVIRWNGEQLTAAQRERVTLWHDHVRLQAEGLGEALFCHATPDNDTDIFTENTPEEELADTMRRAAADLVVCGHTHMQFDREIGGIRVVNAGSVGMPFDEPGAYWAWIDGAVVLERTPYDGVAAAEEIRASGYPDADAFAERNVLRPPSRADMLRVFDRRSE